MSQQPSVQQFGTAFTALGTAAAQNAGVLVPPIGAAAIGGGAGFLLSDFLSATVKTAANLTGKTAVAGGVITKGVVGTGLLGLGWRMTKLGPLGKLGFFAAGAGAFISAVLDIFGYFYDIEAWGKTFGNKIRGWLGMAAVAVESSNRVTRAEYEKMLAEQRNYGKNTGNSGQNVIRL